jgi:two-component sensor histidine kinase
LPAYKWLSSRFVSPSANSTRIDGKQKKVRLSWRETGGPPVAIPERTGFGSLLIEQSFSSEGESRVDFRPDGVRCSLELSL